MPKPVTHVRSIRLTDETWAALAAKADETGSTVNALVSAAVHASLSPPGTNIILGVDPATRSAPRATTVIARRDQAGVMTVLDLQLGPSHAKPGARLKTKR